MVDLIRLSSWVAATGTENQKRIVISYLHYLFDQIHHNHFTWIATSSWDPIPCSFPEPVRKKTISSCANRLGTIKYHSMLHFYPIKVA